MGLNFTYERRKRSRGSKGEEGAGEGLTKSIFRCRVTYLSITPSTAMNTVAFMNRVGEGGDKKKQGKGMERWS